MSILKNKWLLISLSIVIVVILAIFVLVATRNKAFDLYQAGLKAHKNFQEELALNFYNDVVKYPSILGAFISDAEERVAEVQDFVDAGELRNTGQYPEAIDAYTSVLDDYCSPFIREHQLALLEIPFEWAEDSAAKGEFAKAIEVYEEIITDPTFPIELVEQAESALPLIYLEWGQTLVDSEEFDSAIEKFYDCIQTEPGEKVVSQARLLIQQTHMDLGDALFNSEDYAKAAEQYEQAVEIEDNEFAEQAREAVSNIYLAWANALYDDGEMAEAGEKYGTLITTYADTKSASQIPPEAFEPLIYYGQEALENEDFSQALYIFEAVLALGEEREEDLTAAAYLGWGQALNGQEKYFEAYNIFQQVKALTGDSELLTSIEEAEQASIFGFGQLTDLTGQLTIYAALEDTLLINPTYGDSSSERCFYIEGVEECISKSVLELTSLAVGIDEEESRFLLFRSDRGRMRLPEEIEAIKPSHFRYAAILVESQAEINRCEMNYVNSYYRIQTVYSITIYDTRTGELVASRDFKGLPPAVCLNRFTVKKMSWQVIGPPPSMDEIYAWFEEYVK